VAPSQLCGPYWWQLQRVLQQRSQDYLCSRIGRAACELGYAVASHCCCLGWDSALTNTLT
jgi:hypothetical protein